MDEITDSGPDLLDEIIEPRKSLPPLLLKLDEFKPRQLDYLGVSFGLTNDLFRFWKSLDYAPVYVRQTPNELTGEHSCIVVSVNELQLLLSQLDMLVHVMIQKYLDSSMIHEILLKF